MKNLLDDKDAAHAVFERFASTQKEHLHVTPCDKPTRSGIYISGQKGLTSFVYFMGIDKEKSTAVLEQVV